MISNDTYLNILASFAYLHKNEYLRDVLIKDSKNGITNVMIDSGAFTLFNAKQKRDWLTLDNYCNFLTTYGHNFEKYVMLDVINNEHQSKINYKEMLKRGFNPMYVLTMAEDSLDDVKKAVKNNPDICIAGGVTTKGDWLKQRIQRVYKYTNARIHGLGYVTFPDMFRLPLHSVDSSSWLQASQVYGICPYWDNKLKSFDKNKVFRKKQRIPEKVRYLFEQFGVTPKMYNAKETHTGKRSLQFMMSIVAHIEYQKYCYRNKLKLFLAVSTTDQYMAIRYVNKHYLQGTLKYHKFQKYDYK